MAHQFAAIAFTDEVRQVQQELGSRSGYTMMDQGKDYNSVLSEHEAEFIQARDSFYMASVSETDWPYVQHRGGPTGFLKVVNGKTIAFADFSGNRQYVSTGNFRKNNRVALILMDYPNRRRLKILGRVRTITDDTELLASMENASYRARVERAFIIDIEAFDWNCPQHITARYTDQDIEQLIAPLKNENDTLKRNQALGNQRYPEQLGLGNLELEITGIRQLTPKVRAYELRSRSKQALPKVVAGSHLQIPFILESGEHVMRQYSICSNPKRRDIYEIAVLRKEDGLGSVAIHNNFQLGLKLNCDVPENYFQVQKNKLPAVLIAGGIGITPIKAIAQQLKDQGIRLQLHYAGRHFDDMPFQNRLHREFSDQVHFYTRETQRMNIERVLKQTPENAHIYACGPHALLDELLDVTAKLNVNPKRVHIERFSVLSSKSDQPFTVKFKDAGGEITVSENETMLDTMLNEGIDTPYSCKFGECKTCVVHVVSGDVIHRDTCLTDQEKSSGLMCPCVSRASGESITIEEP
jgi:ferredoxin-NADP reductase/predicted pyridoxine 5'-phosphate oxidase superfamily flavin-nucleotide-binding protein